MKFKQQQKKSKPRRRCSMFRLTLALALGPQLGSCLLDCRPAVTPPPDASGGTTGGAPPSSGGAGGRPAWLDAAVVGGSGGASSGAGSGGGLVDDACSAAWGRLSDLHCDVPKPSFASWPAACRNAAQHSINMHTSCVIGAPSCAVARACLGLNPESTPRP